MDDFIYTPPKSELKPCNPSFGFKFCQDTFIPKYWLDKHNITYSDAELEKTPLGLCARIKRNKEES